MLERIFEKIFKYTKTKTKNKIKIYVLGNFISLFNSIFVKSIQFGKYSINQLIYEKDPQ